MFQALIEIPPESQWFQTSKIHLGDAAWAWSKNTKTHNAHWICSTNIYKLVSRPCLAPSWKEVRAVRDNWPTMNKLCGLSRSVSPSISVGFFKVPQISITAGSRRENANKHQANHDEIWLMTYDKHRLKLYIMIHKDSFQDTPLNVWLKQRPKFRVTSLPGNFTCIDGFGRLQFHKAAFSGVECRNPHASISFMCAKTPLSVWAKSRWGEWIWHSAIFE